MGVRWMAVQYVGDTLRIPVANESDMDRPFGSSMLERDVRRIVVNPFSDSPQMFVPEAENDRLRELAAILCHCMQIKASCDDCRISGHKGELARDPLCACDGLHDMLRELGVEVDG